VAAAGRVAAGGAPALPFPGRGAGALTVLSPLTATRAGWVEEAG
jgi:hypothetical protein